MYVSVLVQNYTAFNNYLFFTSENSKAAASIISLSVQTLDRGPIVLLIQNENSFLFTIFKSIYYLSLRRNAFPFFFFFFFQIQSSISKWKYLG